MNSSTGVNLAGSFRPMHPQKLHDFILENNAAIFNAFLDFPKPILIAANGPAIGEFFIHTCACILSSGYSDKLHTPTHNLCKSIMQDV